MPALQQAVANRWHTISDSFRNIKPSPCDRPLQLEELSRGRNSDNNIHRANKDSYSNKQEHVQTEEFIELKLISIVSKPLTNTRPLETSRRTIWNPIWSRTSKLSWWILISGYLREAWGGFLKLLLWAVFSNICAVNYSTKLATSNRNHAKAIARMYSWQKARIGWESTVSLSHSLSGAHAKECDRGRTKAHECCLVKLLHAQPMTWAEKLPLKGLDGGSWILFQNLVFKTWVFPFFQQDPTASCRTSLQ